MAGQGVTVSSGVEELKNLTSLVGQNVGSVRDDFTDIINIPDGANATVNGASVDDSFVLSAGDVLVFSRATGEKG